MATGVSTLGDLKTQLLQRIDRVGSAFFTDAELYSYLSGSYKELYDILIQKFGDDYFFASPYTITTDGTSETYALPADFYKLFGVDVNLNTGMPDAWVTLHPFMKGDRNRYVLKNFQSYYGMTNLRYRLRGNYLWFTPVPASGQTLRVLYAPRPSELTLSADTVDGVSGWEEYIIVDTAIKCLAKEESDPSIFMAQKAGLLKRIEEAAENRDVAAPQTVTDNSVGWGPFGEWDWMGRF